MAVQTIGKETFGLTKSQYSEKLTRIIGNHRANSRLIGEPRDFVLRSCRLTQTYGKLATDVDTLVYLRNVEIAGGRKIKMISLERGETKQPVGKSKLVDALYPTKKIATTASIEEKHYNSVKGAMRGAIAEQIKAYRNRVELPVDCYLTGKSIRRGMKTDVDHIGLSFSEIADLFLSQKELKYTDISLVGPPTAKRFRDTGLWADWVEFHREKARYALVCASANRAKGCGEYETPLELYGSFSKGDPEDLSLDF